MITWLTIETTESRLVYNCSVSTISLPLWAVVLIKFIYPLIDIKDARFHYTYQRFRTSFRVYIVSSPPCGVRITAPHYRPTEKKIIASSRSAHFNSVLMKSTSLFFYRLGRHRVYADACISILKDVKNRASAATTVTLSRIRRPSRDASCIIRTVPCISCYVAKVSLGTHW